MSDFEAFPVPAHHLQLFLQPFNVPVYVTNLNVLLTTNYQPACQIDWLCFALLDKLHISVKCLAKGLVDTSSHHFRVDQVVERRNAALQEVHLWEGYHVHCYFVEIYV